MFAQNNRRIVRIFSTVLVAGALSGCACGPFGVRYCGGYRDHGGYRHFPGGPDGYRDHGGYGGPGGYRDHGGFGGDYRGGPDDGH
jgi:hypothetical protein